MNIDTLSIARDLKAAELPAAQAEAIAAAIGRATTDGVATKGDVEVILQRLDAMDARTAAKFAEQQAELTAKLETVRSSTLIWLMSVIIATAGITIAVLKF